MTSSKYSNKYLLHLVLIFGLLMLLYSLLIFKNVNKDNVKSVDLQQNCNIIIKTKSGDVKEISFTSDILEKECPIKPIISLDKKYVAFDLTLVTKDPTRKLGAQNNTTFVYAGGTTAIVYSHGASEVTKIAFDKNNNLTIDMTYEGKKVDSYTVKSSEFINILNNEVTNALNKIKKQTEIKNWLINFKGQDYTNVKNNSNAVIVLDRYEDGAIIFTAYEKFNSDGHTDTFNKYNFNRLTGNILKDK